jgi:hypothetical protein
MPAYLQPGLTLWRGGQAATDAVRDLQQDLRALGYLRQGIDGAFGAGTEDAVRALQFDLLHNDGAGPDGRAPVAVRDFNVDGASAAVTAIDGVFTQPMARCVLRLLAHPGVARLPNSAQPGADNAQVLQTLLSQPATTVPMPFMLGILQQESGGCHFSLPSGASTDSFITVGLDRNGPADAITSRGYGVGQYTLFHHPPRSDEVQDFMADPVRNVVKAQAELREKFDGYVLGPADRADDRIAEHPVLPLRMCKHPASDPLFLKDCRNCARAAPRLHITEGTPLYAGSPDAWQPTRYYPSVNYVDVPARAAFECDWPYAVRRYNGSGVNSYHYQARVLLHVAA